MGSHPAGGALADFRAERGLGRNGSRSLDSLVDLIADELVREGVHRSSIRKNQAIALPGAYDPAPKVWDLVVVDDGVPVAAVNFTIATGPSIGLNFGNRVQEILGDATNLGRQYESETLRALKPCLAVCFVLEDCEASNRPHLQTRRALFGSEFGFPAGTSYKDRYAIFFERLIKDGRYDAVCYLTSNRSSDASVSEPRAEMGFDGFAQSIADRVMEIRKTREGRAVDPVEFGRMLAERNDLDEVVSGLTSTPTGLSAAEAAVIHRRRELVAQLRELGLAEDVNETKMHAALGNNYWIFGGQYIGVAPKRTLMQLDQHDIPLVCADRSLHIVELKGPESKIVRKHRNHLIVANEIHEAVSQCMNYLRSLDDMGPTLQTVHHNELGLDHDYRRAKGTVVIGHQARVSLPHVTREQIDQTIRSYNAHLSRVQVLTYDDLLDSAERSLNFEVREQEPS